MCFLSTATVLALHLICWIKLWSIKFQPWQSRVRKVRHVFSWRTRDEGLYGSLRESWETMMGQLEEGLHSLCIQSNRHSFSLCLWQTHTHTHMVYSIQYCVCISVCVCVGGCVGGLVQSAAVKFHRTSRSGKMAFPREHFKMYPAPQ